ncbi:hypothetical protein M8818_001400 [Zalaria obscura]|uniref:Uncharacterized protein n=1 Tax=Zalaria obscura TaxID=2024903 RepID=A0ACC3SMT7_9PEZI
MYNTLTKLIRFANLEIGSSHQRVDVDIDMLSADFHVLTTGGGSGNGYDDIWSQTYLRSGEHTLPDCTYPSDELHLPASLRHAEPSQLLVNTTLLSFIHCRPSKASLDTLDPSGGLLGLAPSESLAHADKPSLLDQLLDAGIIDQKIWGLLIIDGKSGMLSLGDTGMSIAEDVKVGIETRLKGLAGGIKGSHPKRRTPDLHGKDASNPEDADEMQKPITWRDDWRWAPLQSAKGWWQVLLRGIWVNGAKVLRDQPAIIDLTTPFILAPPAAARAFYALVPGSQHLPPPNSAFHIFPCLNPPHIHLETGGWNFPVMQGGARGKGMHNHPGGAFSLGRLEPGSGYCVGAVVETMLGYDKTVARDNGLSDASETVVGEAAELVGHGMEGVWVLGEPAFRGLAMVFDGPGQMVGFRSV